MASSNKVTSRRFRSGKRCLEAYRHKASLKAKGKDVVEKKPSEDEKKKATKSRFSRCFMTQQGKTKLSLRKKKCFSNHVRRIRASITPGTVLILLAGQHKGKRVVFLKTLKSGLLLVTGPFRYNGVPLRRVDQRYVIATKTKIDLSSVQVSKQIDDSLLSRIDLSKKDITQEYLLDQEKPKYTVSADRKTLQTEMDKQVIAAIKKSADARLLCRYLSSLFSLGKKEYPHKMVF